MGRPAGWMTELTGRAPMKSPGKPSLRRDVERLFWHEIAKGLSSEEAASAVGASQAAGSRWFRERGGMATFMIKPLSGRYLCFEEREEIALLRAKGAWDQGAEMAQHAKLRIDTGLPVYFCDPQSPWRRATNENTNGLLRQYFPKGTDLARHSTEDLAAVAATLNGRPRKTLGWRTPAEALDQYLAAAR